jgi:hypothetical protein
MNFTGVHAANLAPIGVASVWALNGLIDVVLWYLVKPQFVSLRTEAGRGGRAHQMNGSDGGGNRELINQAGGPANRANGGPQNPAIGGPTAPNDPPMELPELRLGPGNA